MDTIGLITLRAEIGDDLRVASEAAKMARERFSHGGVVGMESASYQLVRFFNVVEQMGLRVAKAFENHIDDERGWHSQLVHRLGLVVPGIRPALYSSEVATALHDVRGFRHVVTHAYDLELDPERISIVLRHAEKVASLLPGLVEAFFNGVEGTMRVER